VALANDNPAILRAAVHLPASCRIPVRANRPGR
jgi:hypothetical protein